MGADRCAGREQFLGHHVAFEEAAFGAAVGLGPGHADPAPFAKASGKLRIMARTEVGVGGADPVRVGGQEVPHFVAQGLGALRQLHGVKLQHRHSLREFHLH